MPEKAYILHARSYLDDSLLLNCLSEHHGRIMLVAKKARHAKSRWRGLLQPFQGLWLEWRGRGSVMTLTQAEGQGLAYFFSGKTLLAALYINELTDRLVQKSEPEPGLFHLYGAVLASLKQGAPMEMTLRRFELSLLSSLGYALPLTYHVASGEAVQSQHYYRFHWQQGAMRMMSPHSPHPEWISGQTLLAMAADDWQLEQTLSEAKKLMRLIFKDILEKRGLQSQTVFAMI
ncbi:MAG: DNA repair protein RecO [Gammaproteobacteria bacterium]|nr:DNA repair protein RecO [Gammaproteobacteria bacterium]